MNTGLGAVLNCPADTPPGDELVNELLAAFQARCVRAYAIADDGNYAVSELELWDTSNQPVSIGKVVFGIEPYVTNGAYAPEGTANNDARYASVLAATGTCGR